MISGTDYALVGPASTNNSSAKPLISATVLKAVVQVHGGHIEV